MEQLQEYLIKALSGCKPVAGGFLASTAYLLFPTEAFETSAKALGITMLVDIITKLVALSVQSKGYWNAVQSCSISSNSLWKGTAIKLYAYLTIALLCGLSYQITMLDQVSVFFATVVYTVLWLREAQSIGENLRDAGADVGWLIFWTKKKQSQILDDDTDEKGEKDDAETI